jgi:choline dehydrogenase-like flavoprotein
VARALAEAGLRVAVLEDGDSVRRDELTARPRESLGRLYRDGGQTMTVGSPPIIVPLGRTIGGSTLVNSGTCFRAPERVLRAWERDLGIDPRLDEHYARIERELHVSRVTPELAGRNAAIARRGAEALGWSGHYLDRNAHGCRGSGVCAFGCPTGAKQHTGATYMAWAHDAGATTYAATRAAHVTVSGGRARGVEAVTRGGGRVTVHAGTVIVACGSLITPSLLAASGVASPWLGRNLSIHPATAVWAEMDEDVDLARGVPQSYCVDEFAAEGIMLEGIAGPPDYLAMAIPLDGARHREVMLNYRRIAQFGLMIADTSRGRVLPGRAARAAHRPVVRYDLNAHDRATVRRGLDRLEQLFAAAGARRVHRPDGLKLMAFHPLGTARAAADPAQGVVDERLQVHGVAGLHVADGSAVPTALGVNPQMTIMALASRLAAGLIE